MLRHHVRGVPVGPVLVALAAGAGFVLAWAFAARRIALARSFADAKVVAAESMRPGRRASHFVHPTIRFSVFPMILLPSIYS